MDLVQCSSPLALCFHSLFLCVVLTVIPCIWNKLCICTYIIFPVRSFFLTMWCCFCFGFSIHSFAAGPPICKDFCLLSKPILALSIYTHVESPCSEPDHSWSLLGQSSQAANGQGVLTSIYIVAFTSSTSSPLWLVFTLILLSPVLYTSSSASSLFSNSGRMGRPGASTSPDQGEAALRSVLFKVPPFASTTFVSTTMATRGDNIFHSWGFALHPFFPNLASFQELGSWIAHVAQRCTVTDIWRSDLPRHCYTLIMAVEPSHTKKCHPWC